MSVVLNGGGVITSSKVQSDLLLEISRGTVLGQSGLNKFGRATDVDTGVNTDIWDRANATNSQPIWVAPTQARIHNIASTSVNDDGDPAGTGARTVQISGLVDWDTPEVSETKTLNGTSNVATTNAYVIVHRIQVLTAGSAGPNAGAITATAITDTTITAQINAGEGQTQMAIYGIPSVKAAYVTKFYGSVLRANLTTAEVHVDMRLLFNPEPDDNANTWLVKHSLGCGSRAASPFRHWYSPYNRFPGPGILKLQGAGSANNLDVSGGFDIILANS